MIIVLVACVSHRIPRVAHTRHMQARDMSDASVQEYILSKCKQLVPSFDPKEVCVCARARACVRAFAKPPRVTACTHNTAHARTMFKLTRTGVPRFLRRTFEVEPVSELTKQLTKLAN